MDFSFFRLTFFVKGFQVKSRNLHAGEWWGRGTFPPPLGAYLLIIGIIRCKGEEPPRLAIKRAGNHAQIDGNVQDANNLLGTYFGHTQGSIVGQNGCQLASTIRGLPIGLPPGNEGTSQTLVFKSRLAGGTRGFRGLLQLGKVGASLTHHVGGAEFPAKLAQCVLGHSGQDAHANAHHLGVRNTGGLAGGGGAGGGVVGSHKATPFLAPLGARRGWGTFFLNSQDIYYTSLGL